MSPIDSCQDELSPSDPIRDRSLFIAWGGAEDLGGDQMVI